MFSVVDPSSAPLSSNRCKCSLLQRGRVPIVVGGTGFYLRWLVYGKATSPPSRPEVAEEAEQLIQQVREGEGKPRAG
jgi:tRNA dimethylallyltransferase